MAFFSPLLLLFLHSLISHSASTKVGNIVQATVTITEHHPPPPPPLLHVTVDIDDSYAGTAQYPTNTAQTTDASTICHDALRLLTTKLPTLVAAGVTFSRSNFVNALHLECKFTRPPPPPTSITVNVDVSSLQHPQVAPHTFVTAQQQAFFMSPQQQQVAYVDTPLYVTPHYGDSPHYGEFDFSVYAMAGRTRGRLGAAERRQRRKRRRRKVTSSDSSSLLSSDDSLLVDYSSD